MFLRLNGRRSWQWRQFRCVTSFVVVHLLAPALSVALTLPDDLTELSLQELMEVEVTSVSKKPQKRSASAAALYVISEEDIRRSGVTNLADALRLAPGVQVARIDANKWAVGIRGFASRLARSVLVLIDGRSVYNPLFAGTYWELQDVILADVDRIEVIRGPGGTLWGANAYNGVINIITKRAKDTQGVHAIAGGGSEERAFGSLRYGGKVGDNLTYRAFGKYRNREGGYDAAGDSYDDWWMARGGFRLDWDFSEADALTFQGDIYDGRTGNRQQITQRTAPFTRLLREDSDLSGGNLLANWRRQLAGGSDFILKTYYDYTFRRDPHFREERNTFDIDFQHRIPLPWRQDVVWGLDYRVTADNTGARNDAANSFDPAQRTAHLISGFLQDEITLMRDQLFFTFGSKFEHNDFSGFEYQPSARLLFTTFPHTLWAAISRAVRVPSRTEEDVAIDAFVTPAFCSGTSAPTDPCFARISGNRGFEAESILAYELGYRVQATSRLHFDIAAFYNNYDKLLSLEPGAGFVETTPPPARGVVPFVIDNKLNGESYGVEVAVASFITDWWRVHGAYSYLDIALYLDGDSRDISSLAQEHASPHHQVTVRSTMDLWWQTELDSLWLYTDHLRGPRTSSYVGLDVRLAKRINDNIEIAAVGQNLLERHRREFAGGTEVPRGGYGQVRVRW